MDGATIIGIDLAKRVFQAHGAAADGSVVFRAKLSRDRLLPFLAAQPRCVVAMEACATAHGWGREIEKLGHVVRLMPPIYVKPYVKRQKNDAADAEAIAEAASRPTMRFVGVKTEAQQARSMLFRTRDLLVRQRTQLINALRGHLAEHGVVAAKGPAHLKRLAVAIADEALGLPATVREMGQLDLEPIATLDLKVADLDKRLRVASREAAGTRRLQTMPGVGPMTAVALETFAPIMETFRRPHHGDVPPRQGLRRLAWAHAAPALDGRPVAPGKDLEDGPARHPAAAHYRRHGGGAGGFATWRSRRLLAGAHDGEEAAQARCDRAGEQDGAWYLGDDDEARGLLRAGGRDGVIPEIPSKRPGRRACEEVDEQ